MEWKWIPLQWLVLLLVAQILKVFTYKIDLNWFTLQWPALLLVAQNLWHMLKLLTKNELPAKVSLVAGRTKPMTYTDATYKKQSSLQRIALWLFAQPL